MADTNQNKRDGFFDDDPFAELTRIMGHDPRGARQEPPIHSEPSTGAAPADQSFEDDFGIDLEKELMGDFDEVAPAAYDAPEAVQDWRAADEPSASAEPFEQPAANEAEDWHQPLAGDDFADALERELYFDAPESAQPAVAPVADQPQPTQSEADFDFGDLDLDLAEDTEAPADERRADEEPVAVEPAIWKAAEPVSAAQPDYQALAALQPETPAAGEQQIGDEPDFEFDADLTFDLDDTFEADEGAVPEQEVAASFDQVSVHEAPAAAEPVELSLEDELGALLAADDQPVAGANSAEPVEVEEKWHPAVNTFGRSNFAVLAPQDDQPAADASFEDEPAAFEAAYEEPVAAVAPQDEPVAYDEPAESTHSSYETASTADEFDAPVSTLGDDDFKDIFGDDFQLDVVSESDDAPVGQYEADAEPEPVQEYEPEPDYAAEPQPEPVQQQSTVAAMAAAGAAGLGALASWLPQRGGSKPEAPEVETVELPDKVQPVANDLDIPDIDYGASEPAPSLYDDLEGEFARAFDEPQSSATEAQPVAYQQQPTQAGQAFEIDDTQWDAAAALSEEDFEYDEDVEQAIAASAYEQEQQEREPRRRGLLIAAAVAGVAVVGTLGVLGASFFGGGSDSPALVMADADPMKVRPENPGGATVPNQDNQVYQRVTAGAPESAPGQERLISSAEEPMDVAAEAEPPLAPGIGDDDPVAAIAGGSDDLAGMGQPKSEDRIEQAETPAASGLSEDVAAVAPRRVRTMIVRPDGTMVARDDAAPAAQAPVSVNVPAAGSPVVLTTPGLGQTDAMPSLPGAQDPATLAADEGGPVVQMPDTVAVVPTRRTEPQTAAQQAAAPAIQTAPQVPAATPASAPAAAAPAAVPAAEAGGGWSMQIASQPTPEGAQSTYQDLARRYGNVLEGRGVNIVRADLDGMGTYYRVRIPAANRDEAIQLCTRYRSAGGSCFVSR